ncbi:MAG: FAD:protein FMN transferase [Rubrivivax sp.]
MLLPLSAAASVTRVMAPLFGSPATLLAAGTAAPASAFDAVLGDLRGIDRRFNAWKPGELVSFNEALRSGRAVNVSPDLHELLVGATRAERRSGGCFNAAIGGLVGAWGFHADRLLPGTRPHAAQLAPWRDAAPSLAQLQWQGTQVRCANARLQVDLGGYAKGWAADRALDRLAAAGVHDAVVDLGGNLAAMGRAGLRPWRVGLRDPAGAGLIGQIEVAGREAVITSGTYERFRVLDGERAPHVIDPVRGTPAAALLSATVVHPSAAWADGAATALLVAGARGWRALATQLGLDQVLVVDREQRAWATPALAARLRDMPAAWRERLHIA